MRHRMAAAALALVGLMVSAYLLLYKLGVVGTLRCVGSGGCERVNTSRWSSFLGLPVAAFGVAGYLVLLGIAMYGLADDRIGRPEATRWLAALSALGVLLKPHRLAVPSRPHGVQRSSNPAEASRPVLWGRSWNSQSWCR